MPKVSLKKASFNGGEISPRLEERDNLAKHDSGCRQLLNFTVRAGGNAAFRPGLRLAASAKFADRKARLLGYWFNAGQAYMLEAGHNYIRFFTNGAPIMSGGAPYEIATSYDEADVFAIQYVRSADVMYLVCPGHPIKTLTRNGHTDWVLENAPLTGGPYQRANIATARTLAPSALTGTGIAIAAVGFTPFTSKDVGRMVSITHAATTGEATITAVTDAITVTADVKTDFSSTAASSAWRLGQYPATICFCQDRLAVGGGDDPNRIFMSKTSNHTDFTLGNVDDDAIEVQILADDVHDVRWLQSSRTALMCGTDAGEWKISSGVSSDTTITPNAFKVEQHDNVGSDTQSAKRVGGSFLFVDRTKRKLLGLRYALESDGYVTEEHSLMANHITASGIVDAAWQQAPDRMLWCCRGDGALLGFTFAPEHKVEGWHRHETAGQFESVETIPGANADETWFVTCRTVGGQVRRFVEIMVSPFDHETAWEDAFCIDCGISYDGAPKTHFTGLDHLAGEEVHIFADGSTLQPQTVGGDGSITLPAPASKVHAGLGYRGVLEPTIPDAGSREGSSVGKRKRVISVSPDVRYGMGARIGPDEARADPFIFPYMPATLDTRPAPFTGEKTLSIAGGWTTDPRVVLVKKNDPTPLELRALGIRMKVNDG